MFIKRNVYNFTKIYLVCKIMANKKISTTQKLWIHNFQYKVKLFFPVDNKQQQQKSTDNGICIINFQFEHYQPLFNVAKQTNKQKNDSKYFKKTSKENWKLCHD